MPAVLASNLRRFPAPLRQGFGGQASGWRRGALMILPPSSGPAVEPIRPH